MRNRRGQSILEISAVITLVTIAVFLIGPTVIRSMNAHFKLWDDSVQDSYSDPLKEASCKMGAAPCTSNLECCSNSCTGGFCKDLTLECKYEWAGRGCGIAPCKANQRLETRLCNPATCCEALGIQTEKCEDDPECCEIEKPTDLCCLGMNSPVIPPGAPNTQCPVGHRVFQKICGSNITYSYKPDVSGVEDDNNPSCALRCLGTYSKAGDPNPNPAAPILCPGDDAPDPPPAPQELCGSGTLPPCNNAADGTAGLDLSVVDTCGADKCEVYCGTDFEKDGNSCKAKACLSEKRYLIYLCDGDYYDKAKSLASPNAPDWLTTISTGQENACRVPNNGEAILCDARLIAFPPDIATPRQPILASGTATDGKCANLSATPVDVEPGDKVTFYRDANGLGQVTFVPDPLPVGTPPCTVEPLNAPCTDPADPNPPTPPKFCVYPDVPANCQDPCSSGELSASTNQQSIDIPCKGKIRVGPDPNNGNRLKRNIAVSLARPPSTGSYLFNFGQREKNTVTRVLGRWGECHVSICKGGGSGTVTKTCKVYKASSTIVKSDSVPTEVCKGAFSTPSCCGTPYKSDKDSWPYAHCLDRYKVPQVIHPGDWYVDLVTGANDYLTHVQISCSCPGDLGCSTPSDDPWYSAYTTKDSTRTEDGTAAVIKSTPNNTPRLTRKIVTLPNRMDSTILNTDSIMGVALDYDPVTKTSVLSQADGQPVACDTGVLAGYCPTGTTGPGAVTYVTESLRTMSSVTLMEGTQAFPGNGYRATLFCLPCPAECNGACRFNTYNAAATNLWTYRGQPSREIVCTCNKDGTCNPPEDSTNCPEDCGPPPCDSNPISKTPTGACGTNVDTLCPTMPTMEQKCFEITSDCGITYGVDFDDECFPKE